MNSEIHDNANQHNFPFIPTHFAGHPLTQQEQLDFMNCLLAMSYMNRFNGIQQSMIPFPFGMSHFGRYTPNQHTLPHHYFQQSLQYPSQGTPLISPFNLHPPFGSSSFPEYPASDDPSTSISGSSRDASISSYISNNNKKRSRTDDTEDSGEFHIAKRPTLDEPVHIDAYTRRPLAGWAFETYEDPRTHQIRTSRYGYSNYNLVISNLPMEGRDSEYVCGILAEMFGECGEIVAVYHLISERWKLDGEVEKQLRGKFIIEFKDEISGLKALNMPEAYLVADDVGTRIEVKRRKYDLQEGQWYMAHRRDLPELQDDWIYMRIKNNKHVARFDQIPPRVNPRLLPALAEDPSLRPFSLLKKEKLPKMFDLQSWIRRNKKVQNDDA